MKPTVTVMLTVVTMLFLSEARAQIRIRPRQITPPTDPSSTNLDLGLSNQPQGRLFDSLPPTPQEPLLETPPGKIPEQNFSNGRLPPGVYETKPYAGIVIVPGPEHDDGSVLGAGNTNAFSHMPVLKPNMEIIPLPPAKP